MADLAPNERILLAEVASFDQCWAGNDHFAQLLHVSEDTARGYIYNLIEKGYLIREGTRYRRRLRKSTQTNEQISANECANRRKRMRKSTQTSAQNSPQTNIKTKTTTNTITKGAQVRGVVLPFETKEFAKAWTEWLEYKHTDHRFRYKSAQTEQRALITLANEHSTESAAIQAIYTAIANGWKGLIFSASKGRRPRASGKAAIEGRQLSNQLRELAETGNITGDNRNRL